MQSENGLLQNGISIDIKMGKKPWTEKEDKKLLELVQMFGTSSSWGLIAAKFGSRSSKQCRERYQNHLRADIKKDHWTVEEDQILIDSHSYLGNQWAKIAKLLPGRTDNAIKNRWHIMQRLRCAAQSKLPAFTDSGKVAFAGDASQDAAPAGPLKLRQPSAPDSEDEKPKERKQSAADSRSRFKENLDLMGEYYSHDLHEHAVSPTTAALLCSTAYNWKLRVMESQVEALQIEEPTIRRANNKRKMDEVYSSQFNMPEKQIASLSANSNHQCTDIKFCGPLDYNKYPTCAAGSDKMVLPSMSSATVYVQVSPPTFANNESNMYNSGGQGAGQWLPSLLMGHNSSAHHVDEWIENFFTRSEEVLSAESATADFHMLPPACANSGNLAALHQQQRGIHSLHHHQHLYNHCLQPVNTVESHESNSYGMCSIPNDSRPPISSTPTVDAVVAAANLARHER